MYKFRKEDKISLPNDWISEQTDALYDKLKQYFICVFCTCNATYPGTENSANPIRCLQKYVGHDTHITSRPVVPARYNFLHKAILNLFGGIRDRWDGEFTLHPVMDALLAGSLQTVMREHALEAATTLRINNAADTSEAQPSPTGVGSLFEKFREQSLRYIFECVEELGKEHLVVSKRIETETPETCPFCVSCFHPVRGEAQCLVVCQNCKQLHCEMLGREALPEDKACSICYEKPKQYILMPCGHHGVCDNCRPSIKTCPWCRKKVESTQKVFET